jgi:hypothetical protein
MDEEQATTTPSTPPPSIDIVVQPQTFTGTPQLSGAPQAVAGGIGGGIEGNIPLNSNVTYKMGPDGQMIAIEKPPFSWKQLGIGAGIPSGLLLLPLILLLSTEGVYDDNGQNHDVELVSSEGTEYTGSFEAEEDRYVDWVSFKWDSAVGMCSMNGTHETCYHTNQFNDGFSLEKETCERVSSVECIEEEVGYWYNSNGTIIFDDGNSYDEPIILQFDTTDNDYDQNRDAEEIYGTLLGIMCFATPILSLIFLIVGFATGRTGLGVGGIISLVLWPVIAIIGLDFLW